LRRNLAVNVDGTEYNHNNRRLFASTLTPVGNFRSYGATQIMAAEESSASFDQGKEISNPFSTGSGGPRFEVQVQSAFAALMLAGSFAPCLPCLPIRRIRLQGRQAGYATDDFIAYVADSSQPDERRLLAQIKHGISFTKSNKKFGESVAAAWKDFNDPASFTRKRDAIAIIAGPLSATDIEDTRRILDWARSCALPHEFFEKVNTTNFSSQDKREKLAVFRFHIDAAAGVHVVDDEVFEFLRHLHVLGFDLDIRAGLMHALLHGIIGRHNPENPAAIWARILEHVAAFNQDAGTLTADSFPEDIRAAFAPRPVEVMPATLVSSLPPKTTLDWNDSEFAEALTVANLLGGWSEGSDADTAIIAALAPEQPGEWLRKMKAVLQRSDSPLSHVNGVWTVKDRAALWGILARRIFGDALRRFEACARKVLSERDSKFELQPEQRFAAQIYGKVTAHSLSLRNGLAETLALLGTNAAQLPNCDISDGEAAVTVVLRELFEGADWQLWASLDRLLPTLAEASPTTFLDGVEKALQQTPCPFDVIFGQERGMFSGGNYMTGLLWALETLAWDEIHLVRVSVILAMLAARDPGGSWGNRPANSLTTIFLPWLPQTHASIEKRIVAVKTVVRERREVGWRLLVSLLPKLHSTSIGTHKPKWRKKFNSDELPRPTVKEYWDQVGSYAQVAVDFARSDSDKLKDLIDSLDSLPEPALNEVLAFTASDAVTALPDDGRLPIWITLSAFVRKHQKFANADWALPKEIVDKIDQVASKLVPQDPTVRHRVLFVTNTWDLHDDDEDWQKSEERLAQRQVDAVREIYGIGEIESVLAFARNVENSSQVGFALGKLESINATSDLLPKFVLSGELKLRDFARGFIWAMQQRDKWTWLDGVKTDSWSKDEIAQLLTYLPFDVDTWKRAEQLLGGDAKEYWTRVPIHRFKRADSEYVAIDALLQHARPRAAIACFAARLHDKQPLDPNRAINALLGAATSNEPNSGLDVHATADVIKALQDDKTTDRDKLMAVEWAYLSMLEHSHLTAATTLNSAIATDPQFFCEIIRRIFRSDHEKESEQKAEPTEEKRAIAQNAYRLLGGWSAVPGTNALGNISAELLTGWIDSVKSSLEKSGHLTVGLQKAGEVFIHGPADADGLFMSHAVAGVLNREDMAELRHGYELAVYNSRGVHFVDPTGAPERDLSTDFQRRAEALENAGYHRLAVTLRSIADGYTREAERNVTRHAVENRKTDA
jgi:hypothetical protein